MLSHISLYTYHIFFFFFFFAVGHFKLFHSFSLSIYLCFWLCWACVAAQATLLAMHGLLAPWWTSLVAEHRLQGPTYSLWAAGLVALWHVGSSWIRDRDRAACIGRRMLCHRATGGPYDIFVIHSPVDGVLGGVRVLATVNTPAVKVGGACIFLNTCFCFLQIGVSFFP